MEWLTVEEIEKMDKNFLSASEAAQALQVSRNYFYKNCAKMKFPVWRFGRKYAIPKDQFLEYLRAKGSDENE